MIVKDVTHCQSEKFFHETSKLSNIENLWKFVKNEAKIY